MSKACLHCYSAPCHYLASIFLSVLVFSASAAGQADKANVTADEVTQIPDLELWVAAEDLKGTEGDAVTKWSDRTSHHWDLTSAGGNQTLALQGINGKMAVHFDGSQNGKNDGPFGAMLTDPKFFDAGWKGPMSIFLVARQDINPGPEFHQTAVWTADAPSARDKLSGLIWFGGLWKPAKHVPDLNRFLPHGVAVVGVQMRTMSEAVKDKLAVPISYVLDDACRAVQFVRLSAPKWNLDPRRIAVGGGSQGALPALYVGCSADRANPQASDPAERLSTNVTCVAAYRSQPSIDPKRMQDWVPGARWGAPALGCSFDQSLSRHEELLPLLKQWSPDWLLHKDAAPIYFENNWGLTQPPDVTEMDYKVHSPAWALGFQKLAQQAGAVCLVKYPDHPTAGYQDIWDFIDKHLREQ